MTYTTKSTIAVIAVLSIAGCTRGGTATSMATSTAAISTVLQGSGRPSDADLRLSCADLDARLTNLYARYSEIEAAEKARARQGALGGAVADVGMAVLGGRLVGNVSALGGINGLRTAAAVSGAASNLAVLETGPDLRTVNDATAIATRTAQLERARVEKGCGAR